MKIKKMIYVLLLTCILFVPKINIISFGNISTGIRIDDILILLAFSLYLISPSKHSTRDKNYNSIFNAFLLYVFFALFSSLIGSCLGYVSILNSLLYVMRKFEYFVLFIIGFDFYFKNNFKIYKFFDLIVIFNFIIIIFQIVGIIGAVSSGNIYSSISYRYYSIFNGPYEMSAVLLTIVPYYVLNITKNDSKNKSIIALVLIFFCIYMSASRTSLILFIVILLYIFLKENKKKFKKMIMYLSLFIATLFLITSFEQIKQKLPRFDTLDINEAVNAIEYAWNNKNINNVIENRNLSIYNYGDYSFNIRINKWMNLIDGFTKNPISGLGLSIVKEAADGGYIRLIVETGIIGLILLFNLIRKIFKIKLISNTNKKYIIYSWIVLLLGGLFIDLFDASKVMCLYWFILGITINYDRIQNKE